jgi:hypothetical protein
MAGHMRKHVENHCKNNTKKLEYIYCKKMIKNEHMAGRLHFGEPTAIQ